MQTETNIKKSVTWWRGEWWRQTVEGAAALTAPAGDPERFCGCAYPACERWRAFINQSKPKPNWHSEFYTNCVRLYVFLIFLCAHHVDVELIEASEGRLGDLPEWEHEANSGEGAFATRQRPHVAYIIFLAARRIYLYQKRCVFYFYVFFPFI